MDQHGRRPLAESEVQSFKATTVECLNNAMRTYGEQHRVPATVREDATRCDLRTAETTIWLSGIGLCDDYRVLDTAVAAALPDCDFRIGDGFCDNDKAMSRYVTIIPKKDLLERMYVPPRPRPGTDGGGAEAEGRCPGRSWCASCSAFVVLSGAVVVLVGFVAFVVPYVTTFKALQVV